MKLSKLVTSRISACRGLFIIYEVTEVTNKVTNKSIDRDIIYNIVTSVTSNLLSRVKEIKNISYREVCSFWGNRGNRSKNTHAEIEKTVTSPVTRLPLKPKSYLIPLVTQGEI